MFSIEKFANPILSLLGSHAYFENQLLYSNGIIVQGFNPEVRYEKLVAILLVLVWLTKALLLRKVLFTGLFAIAHFFSNSLNIITGAHLAALNIQNHTLIATAHTIDLLIISTLFIMWFRNHKNIILSKLAKFKLNIHLLDNDLIIILTVFGFIVISSFLIEIFEFKIWIGFLFTSSKKILELFGYEVIVDNLSLVGPNGTVMMSKACLGFQLMLLFVIMIILTGDNNKARWKYIITGILFLNFINILRFVFLFIHLQKHGEYLLSIEAHSLYNFLTYVIVFLLWILWFEKFADIKNPDLKSNMVEKSSERENDNFIQSGT
ncbi:MAG: hypothetical protein MUO72_20340 [Bacteroidales bacterium]|nr:hypothetical protein [Bacteroidales bacterium]